MKSTAGLQSYSNVQYGAHVGVASPHKLILMLFDGALERIQQAQGAIQFGNAELRGKRINSAIAIVGGLRESLNTDAGADLAKNLDELYQYIQVVLAKAHRTADTALLSEATTLLNEIASAWREIG